MSSDRRHARKISDVVSIQRSPGELYAAWQAPTELTAILRHLLGRFRDEGDSDDAANDIHPAPEIEIVARDPARSIAWQARLGGELRCLGLTGFTPAPPGRGTEVRVTLEVDDEARLLERALAKFRGDNPVLLLREDLRNFKQFMETGELATTRGQSAGERSFFGRQLVHAIQEKLQRELRPEPAKASRVIRVAEKLA